MKKIFCLIFLLMSINVFGAKKYVAPFGNNGNNGLSIPNAWQTLQYTFDNMLAGDSVMVLSYKTTYYFTLTATDTIDMNNSVNSSPTDTTPIYIIGCDSLGNILTASDTITNRTNDTTCAWITTGSSLSSGLVVILAAGDNIIFQNIGFDGGGNGKASYCINVPSDGSDGCIFKRCKIVKASSHGFYGGVGTNAYQRYTFDKCIFANNGGGGLYSRSTTRSNWDIINCVSINNGNDGFQFGPYYGGSIRGNLSAYNNGIGFKQTATGTNATIICDHNISIYNLGDGFSIIAAQQKYDFTNNCSGWNKGYGYNFNGMNIQRIKGAKRNSSYSDTLGATDINNNILPGEGNITTNPLFTNTTLGSLNLKLQNGSPLINAGTYNVYEK